MNKYLTLLLGAVLSLVVALVINKSYNSGKATVQSKWDTHEAQRTKDILNKTLEYEELRKEFSSYVEKNRKTLLDMENEYKQSLEDMSSTYVSGLLNSEARAERYQRIAQDSSSQCRGLADYAGRLDKSIVEGQNVVRQLTKALERRNSHVMFIGGILIEEQKLFNLGE